MAGMEGCALHTIRQASTMIRILATTRFRVNGVPSSAAQQAHEAFGSPTSPTALGACSRAQVAMMDIHVLAPSVPRRTLGVGTSWY